MGNVPVGQRIVCAAVRRKSTSWVDDEGYHSQPDIVVCGARHFDGIMRVQMGMAINPEEHWRDGEQGFIDNRGNFLTRLEAWYLAELAGQIIRRVGGDGPKANGLFSENLY